MRKEKREQCFYSQFIVFFLSLLAFLYTHTLLTINLLKSHYDMTFMLEKKKLKLKLKLKISYDW